MVADLARVGFVVRSVWDFVNSSASYPNALPTLIEHLQRSYPGAIREGIARAMAVREAAFAHELLLKLFCSEDEKRVKDGLAVAIAATTDSSTVASVLVLLRDQSHGSSRVLLLRALKKAARATERALLEELANDPDLKLEVEAIVRRRDRRMKGTQAPKD